MAQVIDLEAYRQQKAAKALAELDASAPFIPFQPYDFAPEAAVVVWPPDDKFPAA